jgi:hypothetical protein
MTTTTMQKTIAICDLNAAIKAKDEDGKKPYGGPSIHTEICLLAQFAHRITGERVTGSTTSDVAFESDPDFYKFHVYAASQFVSMFDRAYRYDDPSYLAKLRRMLPVDVQVIIEER